MISIGLTTWSEHPVLINNVRKTVTLSEYAANFPVVEVDSSFYGVPRESTVNKWIRAVPDNFQFILKAHQVMTLQADASREVTLNERRQTFKDFRAMAVPLVQAKQLKAILFQFPPTFSATTKNFEFLTDVRKMMGNLPIAIEFRNQTWYGSGLYSQVTDLLRELKMTIVLVDEPHNLNHGVPFVETVTDSHLVFVRLHGRNVKGWNNPTKQWRHERTNYNYSEAELQELAKVIRELERQSNEVTIIFNNNGGGDAAKNAQRLQEILGLHFSGLVPKQLDLF